MHSEITHTLSGLHNISLNTHSFGTINNTKQVLQYHEKGAHLSAVERFYIHAEYVSNNHLNDSRTIFPNAIFDTLLKTHKPPPTLHFPYAVNTPNTQGTTPT